MSPGFFAAKAEKHIVLISNIAIIKREDIFFILVPPFYVLILILNLLAYLVAFAKVKQ
jgi:hypothetical protein